MSHDSYDPRPEGDDFTEELMFPCQIPRQGVYGGAIVLCGSNGRGGPPSTLAFWHRWTWTPSYERDMFPIRGDPIEMAQLSVEQRMAAARLNIRLVSHETWIASYKDYLRNSWARDPDAMIARILKP